MNFKAFVVGAFLSVFGVIGALSYKTFAIEPAESTVKMDIGAFASCSGVRLEPYIVLTASHCVESGATSYRIAGKTAHPYWNNKEYDVALMVSVSEEGEKANTSNLVCDGDVKVGDRVRAITAPLGVKDVHTWGKVASGPRQIGRWKEVLTINVSAAPGSSGGPVYDIWGKVVGIIVGGSSAFGGSSLMVPSSVICNLINNQGVYKE